MKGGLLGIRGNFLDQAVWEPEAHPHLRPPPLLPDTHLPSYSFCQRTRCSPGRLSQGQFMPRHPPIFLQWI